MVSWVHRLWWNMVLRMSQVGEMLLVGDRSLRKPSLVGWETINGWLYTIYMYI